MRVALYHARLILLLMLLALAMPARAASQAVRIGVLAFQGKDQAFAQWSATAAYLTDVVAEARFELVPLTYDELNEASGKSSIDFVLTNPEHYVALRNAFSLRPMVTVAALVGGKVRDDFGSTIFAKVSADGVRTLQDVRGKRVAAVDVFSLGGFLMAADEFRLVGIDLRSKDVAELRFVGVPHANVVTEVLQGRADVGVVRSGVLEQMAVRGLVDLREVRVLNDRSGPSYPHMVSTALYPEWPLSAMAHVPGPLAKNVTMALLNMKAGSEAASAARIHGFFPPANYAPVEALMQRLHVYPRVKSMPLWEEMALEYGAQLRWGGLLALVLGGGLTAYLWISNRRLKQMTRLYRDAQQGLQVTAAAFNSQVGLLVAGPDTHIIRANKALCDMLGFAEVDLLQLTTAALRGQGMPAGSIAAVWEALAEQGHWSGELVCRHRAGHDVPCMVTFTALGEGAHGVRGFVGSFVDVTERIRTEAEIRHLAFDDVLTSLPNRRLFLDCLQTDMQHAISHGTLGAVMFIDLDHFKTLNDAHGHSVGDQLLQHIARRLQHVVRPGDLVARLGGDEFVVMLTGLKGGEAEATAQALVMAEAVRRTILEPYALDMTLSTEGAQPLSYQCSGSIGVALYGLGQEGLTEVLKRADVAMYQAKQGGRNAIRLYDPQAQWLLNHKAAMTADLSTALAHGELCLHYQLQASTAGVPTGAECLLRWKHPVRGHVSPAEFIELAEESGAIVGMGNWVLHTACGTLARWARTPGFEHLTMSVNVSPRQFHEAEFVTHIASVLAQTGAPARQLVLEITEGIVFGQADAVIDKMDQLCALGLGFSIDDFGTGYSSLSYLQRLPLREVKIDKAFVRDVTDNPNSAAIVRTIIALGDSLGLKVVSEGVETQAQQTLLAELGCDVIQGYWLGRPMELQAFEASISHA